MDDLGIDCKDRPRTGSWVVMVSVEYRVLQIGIGRLNVMRLARGVLESEGARDAFEQCADFIVEAYRGAQYGWRQILWRDLQPVLQERNLHQKEGAELRLPGSQPGANSEALIARVADLE